MPDNTQPGIHSARPTLAVAGRDHAALAEGLQRLEIRETVEGLYQCEAVFGNWGDQAGRVDFLYFDRQTLDFGKSFVVKLGPDTLFDGRIMALEASFPEGAPPEVTVLAEDRFQDLRMTRRTRTFTDVTDADIVRRIAGDHGLQADASLDGPSYQVLAQVNQSDLAFLRERMRTIDAEIWTEGATLRAQSRARRRGQALELTHGHQLRAFTVTADLATQRTKVSVNGWDVAGKAALQHEADEGAVRSELNGDTSGISILQSALGERKEALAHIVPLTGQEARAVAESHFRHCARRFVVGRGVAETQARLRVGAVTDLKLLGRLFSGKYYVTECRHRFDSANGLRTEFTAERAGIGRP